MGPLTESAVETSPAPESEASQVESRKRREKERGLKVTTDRQCQIRMGKTLSALRGLLDTFSSKKSKILMLGLDSAGKTTILYQLKLNRAVDTIPTVGFNVETVQPTRNVSFTVWDIGGQDQLRHLWRHYFIGCEGLVFVVDSIDSERFPKARDELAWILDSEEMKEVPLVVLANKQDLPDARPPDEIATELGLHQIQDRKWRIHATSAVSGMGVFDSIADLSSLVKDFQKHHKT